MPTTVRHIQMPVDGDGATAESVNAAFRELSELLQIQQHMPLRFSSPGATTYRTNAVVFNPIRGEWLVGGRNTVNGFVATLDAVQGFFLPDYQLAGESTETWVLTSGAPISSCSEIFDATVNTAGLYVVVGAGGFIATSSNGTSWTQRTPAGGYASIFWSVTWNGTVFCAVGENGEIQTSPDGITWTHRTAASSYGDDFLCVRWDGTVFIASGENGEIQTSPDGTTWTRRATGATDIDLKGIACGPTSSIVVGFDDVNNNPYMRRSLDHGVTWVTMTIPALSAPLQFTDAAYCANSDIFCITGQYDVSTSPLIMMGHPETENWVVVDDPNGRESQDHAAVASDGRRFVITADDGDVLFSAPALARRL